MEEKYTIAMLDNALSQVSDDQKNDFFRDMYSDDMVSCEYIELHVSSKESDNPKYYPNEYDFHVAVAYENDEFRYYLLDEYCDLLSKSSLNIKELKSEIEEHFYNEFGMKGYFNIYEAKINDSLELDMLKVQFGDELPKNHFVVAYGKKDIDNFQKVHHIGSNLEHFYEKTHVNQNVKDSLEMYLYNRKNNDRELKYQLKDTDVSLEKLLRTDIKKIDSVLDLKQDQKVELTNDVDEDEKPKRRSRNRLR